MKLWVVEMWNDDKKRYEATTSVGLSRDDGRDRKRDFQGACPNDKFRVKKYVPKQDTVYIGTYYNPYHNY